MSVDKLPSGAYRVRVSAGKHADGKRRIVTRTLPPGSTRLDAERVELELKLQSGRTTGEGELLTVAELVEAWIHSGDKRRAAATQYKYRTIARNWLNDYPIAGATISRVRTAEIETHLQTILAPQTGPKPEGTVGAATVKQLAAMLTGSFGWAARMGWVATNPASDCTPIGSDRSAIHAAEPEDVKAALRRADEIRPGLAALIRFLATTGCRRGEALATRWNDIDGNTITISESVAVVPGTGLHVKDTKTHRSRRLVVDDGLLAALAAQRQRQADTLKEAGAPFREDAFIWSQHNDGETPWRPDTAGKWIREAGVTALRLRHMVATQTLSQGVPLHAVAARLGHSRTSTTLDVYAEAIPAHDQDAADLLGGLLGD